MTITRVPVDQIASAVTAIIFVFLFVAATLSYTAFGVQDWWNYPPSLILRGVLSAFTI